MTGPMTAYSTHARCARLLRPPGHRTRWPLEVGLAKVQRIEARETSPRAAVSSPNSANFNEAKVHEHRGPPSLR